ncbi:MAG: hypothetical protein K2Y02_03125 [Burkholderiaceae bacterium]|nr:hypothetical protein [Burkholderiaceae bacterium]
MSKLATLQIIWPPVPTIIFVSLFDWVGGFGSLTANFIAFTVYLYAMFLPALIHIFWKSRKEIK